MGPDAHFGRLSGAAIDLIDRTRAFMHCSLYHFTLNCIDTNT